MYINIRNFTYKVVGNLNTSLHVVLSRCTQAVLRRVNQFPMAVSRTSGYITVMGNMHRLKIVRPNMTWIEIFKAEGCHIKLKMVLICIEYRFALYFMKVYFLFSLN